jgi:hypothetical protein
MMLGEMKREKMPTRLQRGVRLPNDGMWLEGPSEEQSDSGNKNGAELKHAFDERRMQLCHHLRVWKDKNTV